MVARCRWTQPFRPPAGAASGRPGHLRRGAGRPDMTARVQLRRGDLLLMANTSVLHGRTAFTDPCDPSQARYLVRAWAD
ncbi:TauD/TfdA family dioxygenase [Kitasatospora sp. NPDC048194]|uniref:TauD/TfdA family dioxygenase n=1 Tax=Kitasatospora sp. NPDC048194 TaxID=3364045 RepID=UPI0037154174